MCMFQLVSFVREQMWHKALLMGCSMSLELTFVSTLIDYWLVRRVLYRGYSHFFFFPRAYLLRSAFPSLIFDMFRVLSVCALVLEWFWVSLTVFSSLCVSESVLGNFCEWDWMVLNLLVALFFTYVLFLYEPKHICHAKLNGVKYLYLIQINLYPINHVFAKR